MNICRNVVDPSITGDDNKRDHMVRLDNTQVIGGEDKANRRDIKRAAVELRSEHRGANAALYGRLGYLILIATAGNSCQVSAMELVSPLNVFSTRVERAASSTSDRAVLFLL